MKEEKLLVLTFLALEIKSKVNGRTMIKSDILADNYWQVNSWKFVFNDFFYVLHFLLTLFFSNNKIKCKKFSQKNNFSHSSICWCLFSLNWLSSSLWLCLYSNLLFQNNNFLFQLIDHKVNFKHLFFWIIGHFIDMARVVYQVLV